MKAPMLILMDVDQHAGLPFPRSLREFQRLFPGDAACAEYLEKVRLRFSVHGFVSAKGSPLTCLQAGAGSNLLPIRAGIGPLTTREWLPHTTAG